MGATGDLDLGCRSSLAFGEKYLLCGPVVQSNGAVDDDEVVLYMVRLYMPTRQGLLPLSFRCV